MKIKVTREYLQYLERRGEGKINWDVWDRLTAEFHKWMEEYFAEPAPVNIPKDNRPRRTVYAYDNNGEFVKQWLTNKECADEMKCSTSTVHSYSKYNNILNGYLLSREKLTKDVAFAMYRDSLRHGNVYQVGVTTTKPKKPVYKYDEKGKMVGIYESLYQYVKVMQSSNEYTLRCRLVKGDIITKGHLLSYSFYDEPTAREIYHSIKHKG
jgi:hypothetical protein